MKTKIPPFRVLVIRLSSLGDLLLCTSFLENLPENTQVDWVVRSEFEFALKGHPKIHQLIGFQKADGLSGWLKLVQTLARTPYDLRVDLHRNLRSTFAMYYFRGSDLLKWRRIRHRRVSKERIKTASYFLLKACLPKWSRPTPYWWRFGKLALQSDGIPLPPSYLPILSASGHDEKRVLSEYDLFPGKYFAVMPAASTVFKEWKPEFYLELIQSKFSDLIPILLGRESDLACLRLRELLLKSGIFFKDALLEPDFKKTAILLKHAQFYLGSDTGLAHLAESVGTKSFVVFGPTRPDLGFGPWRKESRGVFLNVACSPCSKDGSLCYRFTSPYACLKKLSASDVARQLPL